MDLVIQLAYLVASIFFIYGLKMLGSPKTARKGNLYSAIGMLMAIVFTLLDKNIITYEWIIIGLVVGSSIGVIFALKVKMTGMPQMVGLLNGFGGGASLLVALSEYYKLSNYAEGANIALQIPTNTGVSIVVSILIGSVTFTGSMIAFGKLQGLVTGKVVRYPLQHPFNALLLLLIIAAGAYIVINPASVDLLLLAVIVSLILGVLLVLPIGGADMPVAISLLNSYSGLAASATGFVLENNLLIIAGALVGASGIILTLIMCRGMNRSLMNVVMGGWASAGAAGPAVEGKEHKGDVKSVDAEELAMILDSASSVIIVPGYGMAVAQAQHAV
ncbi:MAG TPA: NAD(P)(+) transhydrogenase (Re/Si-specific) subunit beta, partial [Ignavibacteriales bacterium]|nr:NAD(P)(+) transhydrogenase (Re/Si-specific) subunit beta [Ignavibacteriales bacterium]